MEQETLTITAGSLYVVIGLRALGTQRNERKKMDTPWGAQHDHMEAKPGFEPGVKALQASALPLGQAAE